MHWNPNAMCDGQRAEDRALWLQQNKGMSAHAARDKVMHEFPQHFQGIGALIGGIGSAVASALDQASTGWNPNAMCDGKRAEDRAFWLQQNKGMTPEAARCDVMREFPQNFRQPGCSPAASMGGYGMGPGCWNPNAVCDGTRAEERVLWLQQNKGLTMDAARVQVMQEFPAAFNAVPFPVAPAAPVAPGFMPGPQPGPVCWNPNAICDGTRAEERVLWLQQNKGLTTDAARSQVMREFSAAFAGTCTPVGGGPVGWNPNAICDGTRAEERVLWLQQNKGLTTDAARSQVMREFPAAFAGTFAPMGGGPINPWNPNALCDGLRAEERVLWLQQNEGMTTDAARIKVMREFPAAFVGGASAGPAFNPNAMCGGVRAEERVLWLQQNEGLTTDAARMKVMREYPAVF